MSMVWNYRLARRYEADGEPYLVMLEAYFDENNPNKINGYCDAGDVIGTTVEDVKSELESRLQACKRPIFEDDTDIGNPDDPEGV